MGVTKSHRLQPLLLCCCLASLCLLPQRGVAQFSTTVTTLTNASDTFVQFYARCFVDGFGVNPGCVSSSLINVQPGTKHGVSLVPDDCGYTGAASQGIIVFQFNGGSFVKQWDFGVGKDCIFVGRGGSGSGIVPYALYLVDETPGSPENATNVLDVAITNYSYSGLTDTLAIIDYSGDISNLVGQANTFGDGITPGIDFGKLVNSEFSIIGGNIDLTKILDGSVLDNPGALAPSATGGGQLFTDGSLGIAGLKDKVRLLELWAAFVGLLIIVMLLASDSVWRALMVPALPAEASAAGFTIPGGAPVIRAALMTVLASLLLTIPSSVIVVIETVWDVFGSATGSAGSFEFVSTGPLTGLEGLSNLSFAAVYALLNKWLPLKEVIIFALNYLAAWFVVKAKSTAFYVIMKIVGG